MLVLLGNSLSTGIRDHFNANAAANGHTLLPASISQFPSREAFAEIKGAVVGKDVIIMQSLGAVAEQSSNDFAMQLLFAADALKSEYHARSVWAVMPFLAYARQDKTRPGHQDSIGMKTFAKLMKASGIDGVSTVDIHSDDSREMLEAVFGKKNVTVIDPTDLYVDYLQQQGYEDATVGGPDAGAHDRARRVAEGVGVSQFHVNKKRDTEQVGVTKLTHFEGEVAGKKAVIIDDIVDSGGTVTNCGRKLLDEKATDVSMAMAHGVFSNNAIERLYLAKTDELKPVFSKIVVTDAIDIEPDLHRLQRQYSDIRERVVVLPLGEALMQHVTDTIAPRLSMING